MARSGGFEPPTAWFVARYSIQLSYERVSKRGAYLRDLSMQRQALIQENSLLTSYKIDILSTYQ